MGNIDPDETDRPLKGDRLGTLGASLSEDRVTWVTWEDTSAGVLARKNASLDEDEFGWVTTAVYALPVDRRAAAASRGLQVRAARGRAARPGRRRSCAGRRAATARDDGSTSGDDGPGEAWQDSVGARP